MAKVHFKKDLVFLLDRSVRSGKNFIYAQYISIMIL